MSSPQMITMFGLPACAWATPALHVAPATRPSRILRGRSRGFPIRAFLSSCRVSGAGCIELVRPLPLARAQRTRSAAATTRTLAKDEEASRGPDRLERDRTACQEDLPVPRREKGEGLREGGANPVVADLFHRQRPSRRPAGLRTVAGPVLGSWA